MSKETAIINPSEHQLTLTPKDQEELARRANKSVAQEVEIAQEDASWQADFLREKYDQPTKPIHSRN